MDQLKTALQWLKQHHFWLLVVIAVGAALGGWYTGSASLASQYQTNSKKIDAVFKAVSRDNSEPFKPNDSINDRQKDEVVKQNEATLAVWNSLYQKQRDEVLVWPKELGTRFINSVKDKSFGDPIGGDDRELYLNYIKKIFDNLLEIVDAEPRESSTGGARRGIAAAFGARNGVDGDEEEIETYLVQWEDQGELREELDLERIPSNLQLWVLQEDLWVYETLLQAIATTNRKTKATRSDRAAIPVIDELKVGQAAAESSGSQQSRLVDPNAEAGVGGSSVSAGAIPDYRPGGGAIPDYSGGGRGGLGESQELLLANRYLNEAGEPIAEVPENYQFGRGFKLLPVRMRLQMDTRWLSTLMWELANAPLQVEITELRFNPDGVTGGRRRLGGGGENQAFDRRPTMGTVVLQGNVYLFNPPEEADLGLEE